MAHSPTLLYNPKTSPRHLYLCTLTFLMLAARGMIDGQSGTWSWQNPLPHGNTLLTVHFTDAMHGWASGEAGTIVHTVNGGSTWHMQNSGQRGLIDDICFLQSDLNAQPSHIFFINF